MDDHAPRRTTRRSSAGAQCGTSPVTPGSDTSAAAMTVTPHGRWSGESHGGTHKNENLRSLNDSHLGEAMEICNPSADQSLSALAGMRRTSRTSPPVLECPARKIFKLIDIQNDSQDLSFVEKIILRQDEIVNLCNDMVFESAKTSDGRSVINFELLNRESLKVVGFFGSKDVMKEIFLEVDIEEEVEVWVQMHNDTLPAGLYVWYRDDCLFVFYWHKGYSLPEATRRDMSCNFIRYIFDLCDTVCACMEGTNLKNSLFTTLPKFSKRQRTQRLQISIVKSSEDAVKLMDGFVLENVPLGSKPARLVTKVDSNVNSKEEFKLSDGHSRVAIIGSCAMPKKLIDVKGNIVIPVKSFPDIVRKWSTEFNLDLRKLSDEDLVVFIRWAKLKEWDQFKTLADSNEKRKTEEKNKTFLVDNAVASEDELVIRRVTSYLDAYLVYTCPWEEEIRSLSSTDSVPSSTADDDQSLDGKQSAQQMDTVCDLVPRQESPRDHLKLAASVPSSTADNQNLNGEHSAPQMDPKEVPKDRLKRLEDNIYSLLVDKSSTKRLVFPTSKVHMTLIQNLKAEKKKKVRNVYTIEAYEASAATKFAPLLYRKKVILCTNGDSRMVVTLYRWDANDYEGPVMTHEEIRSVREGGPNRARKIMFEPGGSDDTSFRDWVDQVAHMSGLAGVRNKAALLSAVYGMLSRRTLRRWDDDLIGRLLAAENPVEEMEIHVTKPVFEFAERKWVELQSGQEQDDSDVTDPVRTLCMNVYSASRKHFHSKIVSVLSLHCSALLRQKVLDELSNNYTALEASSLEEEKACLAYLRSSLSRKKTGKRGLLTLKVEACRLNGKSGGIVSQMLTFLALVTSDSEEKLSITFTKQQVEKERITWKGTELAPMKEDLDRLITDPELRFTPSCSNSMDIIDLDPTTQSLSKVVFLKGGKLLLFVVEEHSTSAKDLVIYLCPKLGVKVSAAHVVRSMKRGFDLFAFDERSRYIAMYDAKIATIKTFRFDESFRRMEWTGADVALGDYAAIGQLIWMDFVSGKNEIVFIDQANRVRLCEVTQPALLRPANFHLGDRPVIKTCVSTHGSCLLVLRTSTSLNRLESEHADHGNETEMLGEKDVDMEDAYSEEKGGMEDSTEVEEQRYLTVEVFRLNDTIVSMGSFPLDVVVKDPSTLQFGMVSFPSQMHLVIHDSERPSIVVSKVLKISSASEVCQLQQINRLDYREIDDEKQTLTKSGPVIDYIYQIFEKYATSPPLIADSRDIHLRLMLKGKSDISEKRPLGDMCLDYVYSSLDRLKRDKGKDFSALQIHATAHDASTRSTRSFLSNVTQMSTNSNAGLDIQMGNWIRKLVCLVPIQIARAENNALKPMVDGLQLSSDADFVDAISLANMIRFGLYEAVLNSWAGPIKVISSMGKQSSGKSYLLNHLSGSLLDVAGGRCTDGVWMTVCPGSSCLYVLLDFEGLGSFERSEQEDMLLSIFNAAVSNLTIFNKKDFHLDKETEAIFQRFQNGVALVKADSKLFKGLFYMAIKDVDVSDVEELKKEFSSKISQICSKSHDNFLTRMYGGAVEISAMPSFNRPEFHESIGDIGRTIEELDASYVSGRSLLVDMKLVIAQISTKDWSPIDGKRVALRVSLLKKHINSAINLGCVFVDGMSKPLVQFDDQPEIADGPLNITGHKFPVLDTGLELWPFRDFKCTADILISLMTVFKGSIPRKGQNDEEWHASFERFISALVCRRKERVLEWIEKNTADFSKDGDIQKLQLETVALVAEVQQNLLLCSCKCERCFLRCVQEKGHPSNHSCNGNHRCVDTCTYCLEDGNELDASPCSDQAGHDGPHDCKEKSHTCGKSCSYAAISSNCNVNCSKKSGHADDHKCNSKQHMCNKHCSLPSCKNPCVSPIDLGDHDNHFCHEKFCPAKCSMSGCNRTCATQDHFHGLKPRVKLHLCGSEHPCLEKCEHKGNCEVLTEVSKKTKIFKGKRATFEYELVSEQNGNRKSCCIVIPAGKKRHDGPHSHSTKLDAVHFCERRCRPCGYFCNRPIGHGGLHNTTHGNMRDVNFVSESEEIDILDRKYSWGESGVAELCQMHCKAQGRGHVHLIHCPANSAGGTCRKIFDGTRHETRKYGPDFDVSKDEMTHAAFWEYVRFEDPCSADEGKEYTLCNHQCKSDEHIPVSGSSTAQNISYCTENLWHNAVNKSAGAKLGNGYTTDDGHHFSCDHSKNMATNVIFIVDCSSSMGAADIRPSMKTFSRHQNNRLGCVYEAILRFIRTRLAAVQGDVVSVVLFNDSAQTIVKVQEMKEGVIDLVLSHHASGSTTYSSGLQHAEQILLESLQNANITVKSPVIVFLSDGGNNGGGDPLYHIHRMKALDPRLQVHTIMFGNDPSQQILRDMAKAGHGTFEVSIDEVQLTRRFEGLAKSLRPKVVSLM